MDFHSLARRDLQSLCKRNKIPANMTNIAMADALQALQSVQGIAEIQEALQFQSPQKLDLVSPAPLPRTTGRRTASRKVVEDPGEEAAEEPREQQASPLPRSRRVTARAPEIDEVVEEERAKKEVQETPKAPNARRRGSKKEEGAVAEAPTVTTRRRATKKEAAETPAAARTCRKASALGAAEAQKEEKPAGVTAGRRARQSSKKEVEAAAAADLMSDGLRKSTRVRGRGAAVKMASLAKEEEEQEKAEAEDYVDQNNDDDKEEEEKEIKDIMEAVLEAEVSADLNSEEKDEKSSEESSENNQNQEDEAVAGFEGSPIRGLIDQDPYQQQQNPPPSAEITAVAVDGEFELQEPSTTIDLGSDMIAAGTSAEATESSEHDGKMMEESEKDTGDNANITANVTGESGDGDSEITAEIEESDGEKSDDLITVEIDESGTDLICSDVAGEIAVEAVEEQKQPSPEIAGESGDEVGELIEDLSDLNLSSSSSSEETSANDEMPPAVSSDNKENGGLTALTAAEAKQQKFESMSLRKLRAAYKETLVTMNTNKGEEKRAALQATDDNCI